jgi:DNA-binding protein HU-beta
MTKEDLVDWVASDFEYRYSKNYVAAIIDDAFAHIVVACAEEGRFSLPGFGTFNVKTRKPRNGFNPRTKQPMVVPSRTTVTFKPAPCVLRAIASPPAESTSSQQG